MTREKERDREGGRELKRGEARKEMRESANPESIWDRFEKGKLSPKKKERVFNISQRTEFSNFGKV